MRCNILNDEQKNIIKNNLLGENPITSRQLAKMFGCSKTTILRARNHILNDIAYVDKPLFSDQDKDVICQAILKGESYSSLAKIFNVSITTISKYVKSWNIDKPTRINHDYFASIDTENKAYTNYGKIKCLTTGGNRLLARIGHYLYDDATIFLKRKREKLNKLLGETELGY